MSTGGTRPSCNDMTVLKRVAELSDGDLTADICMIRETRLPDH